MVERKRLWHFLDASHDLTFENTNYVLLGEDLEEFSVEMNPNIETTENILGKKSIKHKGYDVSADVSPLYLGYDDALTTWIMDIINNRSTGDACKTSYLDVLTKPGATEDVAPTVVWAYREEVMVIPQSYGGDTTGTQVPIQIQFTGKRTKGTFDIETKKFTAAA